MRPSHQRSPFLRKAHAEVAAMIVASHGECEQRSGSLLGSRGRRTSMGMSRSLTEKSSKAVKVDFLVLV